MPEVPPKISRSSCKTALIIGAGPAGLTAAYELLTRTNIKPIIIEKGKQAGGISSTLKYKGNRFDLGVHRFFTKSDRVYRWWLSFFPIEGQISSKKHVFIEVDRKSQIYFKNKLFDYPPKFNSQFIGNLGLFECSLIGLSYLKAKIVQRPILTLEDIYINNFGERLYSYFFKTYTQKLWGIPCNELSADWGTQRVKGVSVSSIFADIINKSIRKGSKTKNVKPVETSLIEKFIYPKYGAGDFWQYIANVIEKKGGQIKYETTLDKLVVFNNKIQKVVIKSADCNIKNINPDYVFSSMPIKELVAKMKGSVPAKVRHIADCLHYRNMIFVRVAVPRSKIKVDHDFLNNQWVYLHQEGIKTIRLQVNNALSKIMLIGHPRLIWLSVEYYCNEEDSLWSATHKQMVKLTGRELEKLNICQSSDLVDSKVDRLAKAYPVYIDGYYHLDTIQSYFNTLTNLYVIGRNGMHRYNNMDHSMLTGMIAVDSIIDPKVKKSAVWEINTEKEYHEEKT